MSKQFIPPIELGQFAPSAAAISSWLYQVWKYLQDNPIPDTSDVERVSEEKAGEVAAAKTEEILAVELPEEVANQLAAAISQLAVNTSVRPEFVRKMMLDVLQRGVYFWYINNGDISPFIGSPFGLTNPDAS